VAAPGELPADLTAPEVRLDIESPFETFLFLGCFMTGVGALGGFLSGDAGWQLPGGLMAVSFVFGLAYRVTDFTYVLDNAGRMLFFHRTFGPFDWRSPVCRFADVAAVTVAGYRHTSRRSSWWEYHVAVVTATGRVVLVSDGVTFAVDRVNAEAKRLAGHLGARFVEGRHQHTLKVRRTGPGGAVDVVQEPFSLVVAWVRWLLLVTTAVAAIVGLLAVVIRAGR